jgi:hypothetical protein
MKTSNQLLRANTSKETPTNKRGKRPLYRPALGSSNWRRAEDGRFADHPVFLACRKLQGVSVSLRRMIENRKKMKLRLAAIAEQMDDALRLLNGEANELKGRSDKLRFAEAFAAAFNRIAGMEDTNTLRVCRREIMMRTTLHEKPSQAELRRGVEALDGIKFTDERWKRLLKKTGLNKQLPTHREKRRGISLRKV